MLYGAIHFLDATGKPRSDDAINAAKTEKLLERSKGLLALPKLEEDQALWILPCNSIHTFGMSYGIDIIFLDRQNRIKKIAGNLKPRRLAFSLLAKSVLETPAGLAEKLKLAKGDLLQWSLYD